ncbi:hypothetical protein HGRIS_012144 [Hohenbuehelia grisea]|uniref:Tubulin-folding cofactor D ARM repeats domain-containing protein n=1 Tax=Hohenbuehelia grisea TaxID=104357 RepID=A0ABR3IRC9_9AGAR
MVNVVMDEPVAEGRVLAAFGKYEEFRDLQASLLAVSDLSRDPTTDENAQEWETLRVMSLILDEYQEQSYLLDPHLEGLIVPVIEILKAHARTVLAEPHLHRSTRRVERICLLIYAYIKCRGYKTILRFFPHEIADLSVALGYFQVAKDIAEDGLQWALRYIFLLWLSLICMIPFDLVQFDEAGHEGQTASELVDLARVYAGKSGLERDAATTLLARIFARKDMQADLPHFLETIMPAFSKPVNLFMCLGTLQFLCELVASGSSQQADSLSAPILEIIDKIDGQDVLSANTIIRKYRCKLISRLCLRLIPATRGSQRENEDEVEIPEVIETVLELLFRALQDRDTVVRWSAAKGVARISERLPSDFADQVLDTVLGLFAIHSTTAASLYDMPTIAEGTWHGACLACAEMARRSLVSSEHAPQVINWMTKALFFDLRKGAHSVGSSVRDAASYVLWAMARTQATHIVEPHAVMLSQNLITVSVFDREIHIRRAASAAFQEFVGRTSLAPHGILVLRETDFYAVSIRRNAFLCAAPQVAKYDEYRDALFTHLLNVTIRHWDISMRQIAAQSIRHICSIDIDTLGPRAVGKVRHLLQAVDASDIHGGLLVLSELSIAYKETLEGEALESKLRELFEELSRVPHKTLTGSRNEIITAAACMLIANTITLSEINLGQHSSVPQWRAIVDFGIKHRSTACQQEAALALAATSRLVDCSQTVDRLVLII